MTTYEEKQTSEHKIREEYVWMKLSDMLPEVILSVISEVGVIETLDPDPGSVQGIADEMICVLKNNPGVGTRIFRSITYDRRYGLETSFCIRLCYSL